MVTPKFVIHTCSLAIGFGSVEPSGWMAEGVHGVEGFVSSIGGEVMLGKGFLWAICKLLCLINVGPHTHKNVRKVEHRVE